MHSASSFASAAKLQPPTPSKSLVGPLEPTIDAKLLLFGGGGIAKVAAWLKELRLRFLGFGIRVGASGLAGYSLICSREILGVFSKKEFVTKAVPSSK